MKNENSYKNIEPVEGGSLQKGKAYHQIPYFGMSGPAYRNDTLTRVGFIADVYDLRGKRGVDIGCSIGGISFGLIQQGAAEMWGIDYDSSAIDLANKVAKDNNQPASFTCMELPNDQFYSDLFMYNPDFIVWMSNYMWIVKQKNREVANSMLSKFSALGIDLIFDTAQHQKDGAAGKYTNFNNSDDVKYLLKKFYVDVDDCGPMNDSWNKRNLFICKA